MSEKERERCLRMGQVGAGLGVVGEEQRNSDISGLN